MLRCATLPAFRVGQVQAFYQSNRAQEWVANLKVSNDLADNYAWQRRAENDDDLFKNRQIADRSTGCRLINRGRSV